MLQFQIRNLPKHWAPHLIHLYHVRVLVMGPTLFVSLTL